MALTYSQMVELGSEGPDFALPACNSRVKGALTSRSKCMGSQGLVVVFMCNHCPFVVHMEDALLDVAGAYIAKGMGFVGISSNDAVQYPEDSFDAMALRAKAKDYPFPYLYDETQDVARAYGAECTPDIFVLDTSGSVVYRGRFDESRPSIGRATGQDLIRALDELLDHGEVSMQQLPSMGCNIKWK